MSDAHARFHTWPVSEVTARLIEVRSVGHTGLDLLTLSSSHFDPYVWSGRALQEVRRSGGKRSCINVSGLYLELFCSGPSWISARVRSH